MIESHIAELGQSLSGPRRAKRRLLAEAQTGLTDTVEAMRAAGVDAPTATARAIADFGAVDQLRVHFQAELDIVATRNTARRSVLLVPLVTLFWNVVWELNPYLTWPAHSIPFFIAVTTSLLALITSLHAATALIVTGRFCGGASWARMQRQVSLLARIGIAGFAVIALLLPAVDPNTLRWPPTLATIAVAAALALAATGHPRRRGQVQLTRPPS